MRSSDRTDIFSSIRKQDVAPLVSTLPRIDISLVEIKNRTRKDLGDINSLAFSIKSLRLLQPIVINQKNQLIDGQRRIEACKRLGETHIPFHRVDLESIILGEFDANVCRKEFTTSERVAIAKEIEKLVRDSSRAVGRPRSSTELSTTDAMNMRPSSDKGNYNDCTISNNNAVNLTRFPGRFTGRVLDNIARSLGVSRNTLEKEKKIVQAAEQDPVAFEDLREMIDQKKIRIDKAYRQIEKIQRKQAFEAAALSNISINSSSSLHRNCILFHEDFRSSVIHENIPDRSVDLIFTDPPYGAEYIPLYKDLAHLAARKLKMNTSIITYVGNYALPTIISIFESAGLKYWWTVKVDLKGPFARFFPRRVSIMWKPMLWFVNGDKLDSIDFMSDGISSSTPPKIIHEWQQSPVEAKHVISRVTVKNQLVLDPMMGSGTTGVAALQLGRRFIGVELEPDRFRIASARLTDNDNAHNISVMGSCSS
jgi:DNA modification methylase